MAEKKSPFDRFRRGEKSPSTSAGTSGQEGTAKRAARSTVAQWTDRGLKAATRRLKEAMPPPYDEPEGFLEPERAAETGSADDAPVPGTVDRLSLSEDQVRKLQAFLNLPADGVLGPQTLSLAVKRYHEGAEGLSEEEARLLEAALSLTDRESAQEQRVPSVWIFYSNVPTSTPWVERLRPGETNFWIHGRFPKGAAYKNRLRAGDTVLWLVGQEFVASGVLMADERRHFYDTENRVRRPVRVIERFATPLSRELLESDLGRPVVRQGSVHPLSTEALQALNDQLQRQGLAPLPYSRETAAVHVSDEALADGYEKAGARYGIRPDPETAQSIGWSGGIWMPDPASDVPPIIEDEPEPPGADTPEEGEEGEATGEGDSQSPDIDVQIPFVLDAPADSEDDLDRGPYALFLARRLHLIWCQLNGQAPGCRAAPPDSDTFIAHVDSPWGGGKSTFANFVARVLDPRRERLTPNHFLRSSLAPTKSDAELATEPLGEVFVPPYARTGTAGAEKWAGARRPWIVARYNAWRDQFVQPPWWQIFLTLHAAVAGELRHDAVSDLKAWRIGKGLRGLGRWLGAQLTRFSYQVWNSRLKAQFWLWAFVLVLIFVLWRAGVVEYVLRSSSTAADGASAVEAKKAADWISLAVAVLGLGGASIATLFTVLSQSFSPDLDFTSEHKHIGVRDPIRRFRTAFDRILRATDRPVLLIVDDLDRCEPRTVVEILRGFQTIIRSPRLFVLLLGDRAWIEGAHDVHHKELVALQGGEASLGSLYVRKVIQLSFRLPVMKAESRRRFARRVLGERDEATAEAIAPVLERVERETREIAEGTGSIGGKEAAISRVVEVARRELASLPDSDGAAAAAAAVSEIAETQVVVAAGADTAQQREVFNAITRLVDCLPNNPRQIKRIFMAFATYEQVGRRLYGYRLTPTGDHGERRAKRWRQLAMWVTLAVEWPETWRAVARRPALLEAAYGPAEEQAGREAALLTGLTESEQPALRAVLRRLRTDPSLVALLSAEDSAVAGEKTGEFAGIAMEADAVYEFNRIIWEPGFLLQPDLAA